ncbi:MAG: hypothetical protein ACRC80_07025, partial [Waterburya sp.]
MVETLRKKKAAVCSLGE